MSACVALHAARSAPRGRACAAVSTASWSLGIGTTRQQTAAPRRQSRGAFPSVLCGSVWRRVDHSFVAPVAVPRRAAYTGSMREAMAPGASAGPSKLSDIAKVPLLMTETSARVREIWLEQFRAKDNAVAGVLAHEEYNAFNANSTACPMFLVPVPRGGGYMNIVWQVQGDRILYKTVEAFQRGQESTVDFGVSLFKDLLASHQLVLLHGELQSRVLSKEEASRVVRYTREAYLDPAQFAWVKRFNENARDFNYEEFMAEFKPLEKWHVGS